MAKGETVDEQLATVLACRGLDLDADILRTNADRFCGSALAAANGETVYVFDGPTRAVDCALANRAGGADIAQGLALGLVGLDAERVFGPATKQAAETAAAAAPGQVLLNRALSDVLAGARFHLAPIEGPTALYRVEV